MSARRQQIVDALKLRLETIQTASGYNTNAGDNVRVNPDKEIEPAAPENTAGIVIRETGGAQFPGMAGEEFGTIDLEIAAHAIALKANEPQDTVRSIWADIFAAIGTDKTLGGLCDDMVSQTNEHSETQGGKRFSSLRQGFRVYYRTARWDLETAAS